jgi:lipoic acid synthetase
MIDAPGLEIIDLGVLGYDECLQVQHAMVRERIADEIPDRLLLVTHPSVITIGKSGGSPDVLVPVDELERRGTRVVETDRGGKTTWHGPGQLVAYPVLRLKSRDVHAYVRDLLHVVRSVLEDYELKGELRPGSPGVWVEGRKIASIGISVRKWVTYHGVALNVSPELSDFDLIVPCGARGQAMTSIERELGRQVDLDEVKRRFTAHFERIFGARTSAQSRHPDWLRVPERRASAAAAKIATIIADLKLGTVCQSARCPNIGECFGRGTATFLILGRSCTRSCGFCAVEHGHPGPRTPRSQRVAAAVKEASISHAVITSVTRDDLEDGGARQFAETILAIRRSAAGRRSRCSFRTSRVTRGRSTPSAT